MTTLSQILAVEPTAKGDAEHAVTVAKATFAPGNANALFGKQRTYRPFTDTPEPGDHRPPESKRVEVKVAEMLDDLTKTLARLADVRQTVERGDAIARADVVVDGHILFRDAPATFLLWLENHLTGLRGLIHNLPVHDPAEAWTPHGDGTWHSETRETTGKVTEPKPLVLYPATPEHPAQVETYKHETPHGTWSEIKLTGAMPLADARALAERFDTLLAAVRFARQRANGTEVEDARDGDRVWRWLRTGNVSGGAQTQAQPHPQPQA